MRGVFVTGTDTGVGKTALAAVLFAAARAAGRDWAVMKPAQTGVVRRSRDIGGDAAIAARAAAWRPPAAERAWVNPIVLRAPCSPCRAARIEGATVSLARLAAAAAALARRHEALIVEGSGGVMVPLCGRRTMLDLMAALGLSVVVAARPGLGTINHTLLTCEAIQRRGLRLAGVVLVQSAPGRWTPLMNDNLATLRRFHIPALGRLPHMVGFPRRARAAVRRLLVSRACPWLAPLLDSI